MTDTSINTGSHTRKRVRFSRTAEQVQASRAARQRAALQSDLIRIWTPDAGHGYLINRLRSCRDESGDSLGWFRAMRSHAREVGGNIEVPTMDEFRDFIEEADFDPTLFYVGHAGNAPVVGFPEFLCQFGYDGEEEHAERMEFEREARRLAELLYEASEG